MSEHRRYPKENDGSLRRAVILSESVRGGELQDVRQRIKRRLFQRVPFLRVKMPSVVAYIQQ